MNESDELLPHHEICMSPTPSTPSQPSTPVDEGPPVSHRGKAATWKYSLIENEPSWEMLTVRSRSDSKDSDVVRLVDNLPLRHAEEEDWHQTAEVSIARSLSVTRPRMQLLRPVRIGGERLVARPALTPTLVDVHNRKSVAVLIEG